MKKLLRIDSSPNMLYSHSRQLADYFETKWRDKNPDSEIILRDLAKDNIPHIHASTIQGFFTPPDHLSSDLLEATKLSDEIIAEVEWADEIVISVPLYNFSIPSSLKAYIDQLVRVGKTFKMDDQGNYTGLIQNKNVYILNSKGGIYKNTPMESIEMLESYLKLILGFIGLNVKDVISLEGTALGEETVNSSTENARKQVDSIFE